MKPVRLTIALALAGAGAAALPGVAGAVCTAGCTVDGPAPIGIAHQFIPGQIPSFVNPVGPSNAAGTSDAVAPTGPVTQTSPTFPSDPTGPTGPITPTDVVFPSDPIRPSHTVHFPTDPITPADPVLPAHPTDSVSPSQPVVPTTTPAPPTHIQVVLAPPTGASNSSAGATSTTGAIVGRPGVVQVSLALDRLTRSGHLRLRVSCPASGARCAGTLGLRTASRLVGRARFTLAAGERGDVILALSHSARNALTAQPILLPLDGKLTFGHAMRWRGTLVWMDRAGDWLVPLARGDSTTPIGTKVGRGQCTDWALDRRPDLKGVVSGDAWRWTGEARNAGLPVTKTPHVGDVVVFQPGVMGAGVPTGHVAYVESVQRDASGKIVSFTISEQNWNVPGGTGGPSTTRTIQMSDVPPNGVDFIG